MSLSEFLTEIRGANLEDSVASFRLNGTRFVVLFDDKSVVGAVVASPGAAAEEMAKTLRLEEPLLKIGKECGVAMTPELQKNAPRRFLGNPPLQTLAWLMEQDFYSPGELGAYGNMLWVSPKKPSMDLWVPLAGKAPVLSAEIQTDIRVDVHAATVLAHKLGYTGGSSESAKRAIRSQQRVGSIFFYSEPRDCMVCSEGDEYRICVASRASELRERSRLTFPLASQRHREVTPAKPTNLPHVEPKPVTPMPAPAPAAPVKKLTPPEALDAYIRWLKEM